MKCRTYSTLTAGTMYIHVYDTLHYCKDLMQPYVKKMYDRDIIFLTLEILNDNQKPSIDMYDIQYINQAKQYKGANNDLQYTTQTAKDGTIRTAIIISF